MEKFEGNRSKNWRKLKQTREKFGRNLRKYGRNRKIWSKFKEDWDFWIMEWIYENGRRKGWGSDLKMLVESV